MATAELVETVTAQAGAAVSIYRFVQLQSDGKFDQVGTAQARADGVSAEAAAADEDHFAMAVMKPCIMKVEAGAAVSVGDVVASDTSGRAITAVASAGNYKLGVALEEASAAGEVIRILLMSPAEDGGAS